MSAELAPERNCGDASGPAFGLPSATALVVANMVGAGVFTTSGYALADLGTRWYVLAAWFVGGLIALCGAISYGGLVRHITGSGGEYLFLSRVVHPCAGFMAGWISLVAGFTGAIAFAALAFAEYLPYGTGSPKWVAAGTVIGFGLLHGIVRRPGVVLQNIIVVLKMGMLAVFLLIAVMSAGDWPGLRIPSPAASAFSPLAFAATLVWVSLSYSGFNAAVYVAGEVRDPAINVPRSMALGTALVMALYLGLNAVFLYAPLPEEIVGQATVSYLAAMAVGGERLAAIVRAVICLALLSSVSSMVIAGPRVYAKMAEDGVFPRIFRIRDQNVSAAIFLQAGLALVFIFVSELADLLSYLGLILSVSAAVTVASLFVLSHRQGRPVAVPGYPFVPLAFVVATLVLASMSVVHHIRTATGRWPTQVLAAAVTLIVGLVVYLVMQRTRSNTQEAES